MTQQHTLLLVGVCGRAARRRRRRHRRDNCGGHVCGPVSSARSVRWWLQLQPATTRDDRAGQPGGAHYDGLVSITRCCWSAYAGARLAADATACRGLCARLLVDFSGRLQRGGWRLSSIGDCWPRLWARDSPPALGTNLCQPQPVSPCIAVCDVCHVMKRGSTSLYWTCMTFYCTRHHNRMASGGSVSAALSSSSLDEDLEKGGAWGLRFKCVLTALFAVRCAHVQP